MLSLKSMERLKGPVAMLGAVGIDILIEARPLTAA